MHACVASRLASRSQESMRGVDMNIIYVYEYNMKVHTEVIKFESTHFWCHIFISFFVSPLPQETIRFSTTMKRRHPTIVTSTMVDKQTHTNVSQQYTLKVFGFIFFVLADSVQSQFSFQPTTAPCPSNSNIQAYTSVEDINADMDTEVQRIADGGSPPDSYSIVFCPDMTFDTSQVELMPKLNLATFTCGETGDVNGNCIFSGGSQNIRVRDVGIDGYIFETMSFVGFTFQAFTSQALNLRGIGTEAVFRNCVWQVSLVSFVNICEKGPSVVCVHKINIDS